ncbi:MAG: thioredoxin domain-containing protein [Chthonomonadales bacterium]
MKVSSEAKLFIVILVAAVALVGFVILPSLMEKPPAPPPGAIKKAMPKEGALVTSTSHIRGKNDAALTVVVFSDFECPQCAGMHPKLLDLFNAHKKNLRIVYHSFRAAPDHINSGTFARAAEAAGDQGKFWEMHDLLFANQNDITSLDIPKTRAKLDGFAKSLKLDMMKYTVSFSGPETLERYQLDNDLAVAIGVPRTPWAYCINEVGVVTETPNFEDIQAWVEQRDPRAGIKK